MTDTAISTRLRMGRASDDDIHAAVSIGNAIEAASERWMPRAYAARDEDPAAALIEGAESFDADSFEHLKAFHDLLVGIYRRHPGALCRVNFGMATLLDPRNEIVDPSASHLKLHPRFEDEGDTRG